ncbi:MAG: glucosaminidase domain-containing protein [Prevotellaceae bacterium]|jgi:LysM repeat protein|nr:glucosaminidase domain-containing protein [Prevotellaceae bacterium]
MKKILSPLLLFFIATSLLAQGQNKQYIDYIAQYKDIAIREMTEYGIPASITLAQGLLESGAGKSRLATEANNHFGIKCKKNWTGKAIYHDDDAKQECFRHYATALESYEDHSRFLVDNSRYASLFALPNTDYKGWAKGLKAAGYATDPAYPSRLIKIIEDYNLHAYDDPKAAATAAKGKAKTDTVNTVAKQTDVAVEKPKKKSLFAFLFGKNTKAPSKTEAELNKVFTDSVPAIAEITAYRSHDVQKINGVRCVIALEGDTYASIADEFGMYEGELLRANEVQYGNNPQAGDIVFLTKKKKRGNEDFYTVQEGETVYQISQKKGIRVRALYRLNNIVYGRQVNAGDEIKLR